MNVSGGLIALGTGLDQMAGRAARKEELEWQAAREENMQRLRQKNALEVEGVRNQNDNARFDRETTRRKGETDAEFKFRSDEAAKSRKGALELEDRRGHRDDEREKRLSDRDNKTQLSALRRHRSTTLSAMKGQETALLKEIQKAKASGIDADVEDLQSSLAQLRTEREAFDGETQTQLVEMGDTYFKDRTLSDDDMNSLVDGEGNAVNPADNAPATGRPSAAVAPSQQDSAAADLQATSTTPRVPVAGRGAIPQLPSQPASIVGRGATARPTVKPLQRKPPTGDGIRPRGYASPGTLIDPLELDE